MIETVLGRRSWQRGRTYTNISYILQYKFTPNANTIQSVPSDTVTVLLINCPSRTNQRHHHRKVFIIKTFPLACLNYNGSQVCTRCAVAYSVHWITLKVNFNTCVLQFFCRTIFPSCLFRHLLQLHYLVLLISALQLNATVLPLISIYHLYNRKYYAAGKRNEHTHKDLLLHNCSA